jgi:Leucine-rich repeat (LRR) protein
LNASNIGSPDLKLLTESGMKELLLSGTVLNHLFELDQLGGLQVLDISRTRIRNLTILIKYPKLTSLDISGIDGLAISQQLVWSRDLNVLTVSEEFKDDPTIRSLANRGVIIIYTDE